jgi:hypothetical protein
VGKKERRREERIANSEKKTSKLLLPLSFLYFSHLTAVSSAKRQSYPYPKERQEKQAEAILLVAAAAAAVVVTSDFMTVSNDDNKGSSFFSPAVSVSLHNRLSHFCLILSCP